MLPIYLFIYSFLLSLSSLCVWLHEGLEQCLAVYFVNISGVLNEPVYCWLMQEAGIYPPQGLCTCILSLNMHAAYSIILFGFLLTCYLLRGA